MYRCRFVQGMAEAQHRKALLLWSVSLSSPILYIILAWLIQFQGWIQVGPHVERTLDTHGWHGLLVALGAAALAIVVLLRRRRLARLRRTDVGPERALSGWMMDFFLGATAADAAAFVGLVGFLLTSRHEALLIGGMAGYLGYAMAYPSRGELLKFANSPAE